MSILSKFDGDFYDADYFERGKESGKGWLMNYRWMPRRSYKEAFGFIDYLELDDNSYILDVGCAKGFIVKALRGLDIKADGADISNYALSFAPEGCWNCTHSKSWDDHKDKGYTHVIMKDVFEHIDDGQISNMLSNIGKVAKTIMCVMPMGDNGQYRIQEMHEEISHVIIQNEEWWKKRFEKEGWKVKKSTSHVPGIKDNWQSFADGKGNHVFVIEKNSGL